MQLNPFDISGFVAFFGFVVAFSMFKSRKERTGEDFFLAGRGLVWPLIGFSLIAANISTEQFVGMNGQAAGDVGLAVASYDWIAAITLVFVAIFFLPMLLRGGVFTVLEKMVGEDNVTHVPLSQFGNRFALTGTLGKMLNSTTESSHGLDELAETLLKSYTSGDRMTFERKYKEPMHARPTAKVMISTNQLPQFADKSLGIWRRMLFVPFDKSYPPEVQNLHLVEQLSYELPGIFNWAKEGLRSLGKAGRFVVPQECKAAIEQYRRDVNPARSFLLDNFVESPAFEGMPCKEVYESYVTWCHDNGYRPLHAANFGKEVKRTLPAVQKEYKREGFQRIRFYSGLATREGSEPAMLNRMSTVAYGASGARDS